MKNKVFINDDTPIELRLMNHIIEVKESNFILIPPSALKKLNDKNCTDIRTGEVRTINKDAFFNNDNNYEFGTDYDFNYDKRNNIPKEKTDPDKTKTTKSKPKNLNGKTRLDNPKSLTRSRKATKNIIINNFEGIDKTQFITLLYDYHIDDVDRAGKDMDALIKKIRRNYATKDNKVKYFYVIEFGNSGSIHFHLILYWDKFIPSKMVQEIDTIWKKGVMHYDELKETKDILFLAAYLTYGLSGETDENVSKYSIANTSDEKKKIKHQRMGHFKANQKNFRHSINMEQGEMKMMTFKEAKEQYCLTDSFYDGLFFKNASTILDIEQKYKYYIA
jgi:hypothetical protein